MAPAELFSSSLFAVLMAQKDMFDYCKNPTSEKPYTNFPPFRAVSSEKALIVEKTRDRKIFCSYQRSAFSTACVILKSDELNELVVNVPIAGLPPSVRLYLETSPLIEFDGLKDG